MPDRLNAPQTKLPQTIKLPKTVEKTTANGIKLMSLDAGTQQVIRLTIVFQAGTRYQSVPFASSAMLNMLSEGSRNYTSAQIADKLDFYGIYYDTNIDRDYSMITVSCLNKFLPQTLELLEDMLLYPLFDERELSIYALKRKQNIKIEREKPSFIAREEFSKALFGAAHPYGVSYDEQQYDTLTSDLLREHYDRYYGAENCFAVTSGMVTQDELLQIETLLAKIPSRKTTEQQPQNLTQFESTPEIFVERAGALQSSIRMGKVLFPKWHADFNGMQVLSMVLGGYFSSRLVSNLREDKGYTYGIYAAMVNLEHAGYFAVATDVSAEHTNDAVTEIIYEIERLRTELIPEQELEMVRNTIVGELMRLVDGPFGIADITIESQQCGRDNSMLNEFLAEVRTISSQRLQELAVKYLDSSTMSCVIVGQK